MNDLPSVFGKQVFIKRRGLNTGNLNEEKGKDVKETVRYNTKIWI